MQASNPMECWMEAEPGVMEREGDALASRRVGGPRARLGLALMTVSAGCSLLLLGWAYRAVAPLL